MKKKSDFTRGPLLDNNITLHLDEMKKSGDLSYRSGALPIWCPGCGYYGITHAVNHALSELGIKQKNLVVVSGIGCAGRYPFFSRCYGFHVVHGRTLPVAAGVRMAAPDLTVLALAGDGDGLAIGGGHLPHAIRRNVDITHIIFDNGIYGLTKGQSSPTTPRGQVTDTHPYGNPETPLNPALMGLTYGTSFLARGFAGDPGPLSEILVRAISHKGFSMVHIISPCVTFDHVNLLYDRLRDLWSPVPDTHDPADLKEAMDLALAKDRLYYGIYFEEERPTWDELAAEAAAKAAEAQAKRPD